jgi:protein-disulfide isomerase
LLAKGLVLRPSSVKRLLMIGLVAALGVAGAQAQTAVGGQVTHFTDTSMLKPPAGQKIAIVEWEDLECPACAHAFPIVHEAIKHYNIPLVRYDFMIPGHVWSKTAEIDARFMQDNFGMDYATEYRREVFASQYKIASQDDLSHFTQQFLQSHGGKQLPFVMDPKYLKEVQTDHNLGMKLGLMETPTIVVVTPKEWIQVKDTMELYQAIDKAESDMGMKSTARASNEPSPAPTPETTDAAPAQVQTSSISQTPNTAPASAPGAPTPVPAVPVQQAEESSHWPVYAGVGGVVVVGGIALLMKGRKKAA